MFYFAYGSNMSSRRIANRIPSALLLGCGRLNGHQLRFHKVSKDGSAKCNVLDTDHPDHFVLGVIYKISPEHKQQLDLLEGLGQGYETKTVDIKMETGLTQSGFVYFASRIDCSLKPYDWYKQHVLIGANEHDFPESYISKIESVEAMPDKDEPRASRELAIYG